MLEKEILMLSQQICKDMGYLIVDIKIHRSPAIIVQVFLEKEDFSSVSVEDCAKFSRALSVLLDVNELIDNRYTLEISSPGLDRKLNGMEDFQRFKGENVVIRLKDFINGYKKLKGKLYDVNPEGVIILLLDEQKVYVPLDMINQANLDLVSSFNKSNKDK